MIYFQARAYLHREYLPFTPEKDYDPTGGEKSALTCEHDLRLIYDTTAPCDGPDLVPAENHPSAGF